MANGDFKRIMCDVRRDCLFITASAFGLNFLLFCRSSSYPARLYLLFFPPLDWFATCHRHYYGQLSLCLTLSRFFHRWGKDLTFKNGSILCAMSAVDWWNQVRQWKLLIGCCFLFGLLLLAIFVFNNDALSWRRNEHHETHKHAAIDTGTKEWPLCVGDLLENKESHYEIESTGVSSGNRLNSKTPCRIMQYKAEQMVACLDELNDLTKKTPNRREGLHFAFIGDSRIRQQFFNFVRLVPQYDKKSSPSIVPENYHNDVEVTSNLLNIRVSFKWRPLVSDDVTEEIRRWVHSNETDRPYLIVLGMAVWHMLQSEGADYQLYLRKLLNLAPVLDQLANDISQIIWLNQYPSVDFNKEIGVFKTDGIVSEKIHRYNEIARRVFQNHTKVRVWDSSNLLAEEYVRACTVLERDEQSSPLRRCPSVQFNCNDFLHTGDVALSQATQLLVNDVCNELS